MRFRAGRRAAASSCCVRVTTLRNVTAPASLLRCAAALLRSRCCARVAALALLRSRRYFAALLPYCVAVLPRLCAAVPVRCCVAPFRSRWRCCGCRVAALLRFCVRVAALSRCRVVALPRCRVAASSSCVPCRVAAVLRRRIAAFAFPCCRAALPRCCVATWWLCRFTASLHCYVAALSCCRVVECHVAALSVCVALLHPSVAASPRCCILTSLRRCVAHSVVAALLYSL